jgi:hypothetical protein
MAIDARSTVNAQYYYPAPPPGYGYRQPPPGYYPPRRRLTMTIVAAEHGMAARRVTRYKAALANRIADRLAVNPRTQPAMVPFCRRDGDR